MKKDKAKIVLFAAGLLFSSAALFAQFIGLDREPGEWGMRRWMVLVSGILLIFLSFIHVQLERITRNFRLWMKTCIKPYKGASRIFSRSLIPVGVITLYIWFASTGTWTNWESPTYYYSSLAEAFLNGNLHLPITPDPQLLALENPYDPSTRGGIEVPVDLSLYDGKFYMYWGPVPSLLLSVIQFFTHKHIGDLTVALVFVCGIFLAQSALLFAIWDQNFKTLPNRILHLTILLGGLTGPIILLRHNYENAKIYEASIAGSQFFLLCGLLSILSGIKRPSMPGWHFALGGFFWILSIGTRQILAAPIGIMVVSTTLWIATGRNIPVVKIRKLILLGLPFILGFVCLGWYNWARFNSVTESGFYYQLAGPNLREHSSELFSQSYIPQNLYNYLFNPPRFISKFPFIFMEKGSENPVFHFFTVPDYYNAQPITGLLYIFPFMIFAITPIIVLLLKLYNEGSSNLIPNMERLKLFSWMLFNLGGSFLIAFILLTMFFWVGMRYLGDYIPELIVLSALGFWSGYRHFVQKPVAKGLYTFLGVFLASISILASILLVISTNSKLVNLVLHNIPFLK